MAVTTQTEAQKEKEKGKGGTVSSSLSPWKCLRVNKEMGMDTTNPVNNAAQQLWFDQDEELAQETVDASTMVTLAGNAGA